MSKTVIEMAKEAGFMLRAESVEGQDDWWECFDSEIETLVALVRADEREACAKVCDELPAPDIYSDTDKSMWDVTCMDCAAAIRNRSNT